MNIWLVNESEKTKMIAEKYNLKCSLILTLTSWKIYLSRTDINDEISKLIKKLK